MSYNGWTNRETWNVSLWLSSDEGLYFLTKKYLLRNEPSYKKLVEYLELQNRATGDGVSWLDENLNYSELDEVLKEWKVEVS